MTTNKITWNEETTATLEAFVENQEVVSQELVASIAEEMGGSTRSIGAKLRKLGYEVAKVSPKVSAWTPEMEEKLTTFLNEQSGNYTYAELTQLLFASEGLSDKQVQGKILSMELTNHVKPTPKREAKRTYSPEQEEVYIRLALANASLEEIAAELGVSITSARGKGLSLVREKRLEHQPVQATSNATRRKDPLDGIDIANSTLEDICTATGMSTRGVKSALTRRGLVCLDHDGEKRRSSLDAKKEAQEAQEAQEA